MSDTDHKFLTRRLLRTGKDPRGGAHSQRTFVKGMARLPTCLKGEREETVDTPSSYPHIEYDSAYAVQGSSK